DALDPAQIAAGVRGVAARLGSVDRLLGTLEQLQVPLGEVRDALGLSGMGAETAKNFRDKARMKDVLRAAGVPCARHRLVESEADAFAFAHEVGYPLVARPPAGAGAKATFRVDGDAMMADAMAMTSPSPASPLLLVVSVSND